MSNGRKPYVREVSGDFYKRGRCKMCGKSAERSKTFWARDFDAMMAQGRAWEAEPMLHKKCEPLWNRAEASRA